MLPFLQPKRITSIIVQRANKSNLHDVKPEHEIEKDEEHLGLEACAEDLLKAIDERSIMGIKKALKNAFEILDSEPHVEGPHIEEEE